MMSESKKFCQSKNPIKINGNITTSLFFRTSKSPCKVDDISFSMNDILMIPMSNMLLKCGRREKNERSIFGYLFRRFFFMLPYSIPWVINVFLYGVGGLPLLLPLRYWLHLYYSSSFASLCQHVHINVFFCCSFIRSSYFFISALDLCTVEFSHFAVACWKNNEMFIIRYGL